MQTSTARASVPVADIALRAGIVALTLATAYIHSTLGGALFTLNAVGYVVLAAALVAPLAFFANIRWLTRLALIAYTASTVIGWYLMGPRYDTAYIAKGIELVLIALLVVESYHHDGSPLQIARRIVNLVTAFVPGASRNGGQATGGTPAA
jgi:hypothetical protein